MKRLTLDELDLRQDEVEQAIDATDAPIDRWCSGPDWVVPVHLGFGSDAEPLVLATGDDDPGFALLARYRLGDGGTLIAGLEALWGFASPLVGARIDDVAAELVDHLASQPDWHALVVPGMPTPTGPHDPAIRVGQILRALGSARIGTVITRQVADLDGDLAHWEARRSARFRRNLRRARRLATDAGVTVVDAATDPDPFARAIAIERRSWKGRDGSGMTSTEMAATYEAMVGRLQRSGRLRLWIARLDGDDVGFILGGVRGDHYRGLQISYTTDVERLSIGHVLQLHQLEQLHATETIRTYDLGMDFEYKRRWADRTVPMSSIVVERTRHRRPGRLGR